MYSILFKKIASKELDHLPNKIAKNILKHIYMLENNPRPAGCLKLHGSDENLWRIRVGDYRVLYTIEDVIKVVNIRRVRHRKDVYG